MSNPVQQCKSRCELLERGILRSGGVCAEVGVQHGGFSELIWKLAEPQQLHLIDLWLQVPWFRQKGDAAQLNECRRAQELLCEGIKAGNIFLHQGWSVATLNCFPDGFFDWVYIDADHTLEACLADLQAASPKVKPGGVLAGHDYHGYRSDPRYGVKEAVEKFCDSTDWSLAGVTQRSPHGGIDPGGRSSPSFVLERC